jgi:hypothetical protein
MPRHDVVLGEAVTLHVRYLSENYQDQLARRATAKFFLRACDFGALDIHHKMTELAAQRGSKSFPTNFFAAVEVHSASFDFRFSKFGFPVFRRFGFSFLGTQYRNLT